MASELPLEHVSNPPETESAAPPAVVVLHGRGADEQDLLGVARQLPDRLHVLSVRAPYQLGPGYTWYDLDLSGGGLEQSQPDSDDYASALDRLATFIPDAIDRYGLDPDALGLLGFSQGTVMSLGALAERPAAYAWVVGLHGYLPARFNEEALSAAAGTPVFLGAGTADEVIPAVRAEDAADRLAAAGVEVTFRTYGSGHAITPPELADVVEWVKARVDNVDSEGV